MLSHLSPFDWLPHELLFNLLLPLEPNDLNSVCRGIRRVNAICNTSLFRNTYEREVQLSSRKKYRKTGNLEEAYRRAGKSQSKRFLLYLLNEEQGYGFLFIHALSTCIPTYHGQSRELFAHPPQPKRGFLFTDRLSQFILLLTELEEILGDHEFPLFVINHLKHIPLHTDEVESYYKLVINCVLQGAAERNNYPIMKYLLNNTYANPYYFIFGAITAGNIDGIKQVFQQYSFRPPMEKGIAPTLYKTLIAAHLNQNLEVCNGNMGREVCNVKEVCKGNMGREVCKGNMNGIIASSSNSSSNSSLASNSPYIPLSPYSPSFTPVILKIVDLLIYPDHALRLSRFALLDCDLALFFYLAHNYHFNVDAAHVIAASSTGDLDIVKAITALITELDSFSVNRIIRSVSSLIEPNGLNKKYNNYVEVYQYIVTYWLGEASVAIDCAISESMQRENYDTFCLIMDYAKVEVISKRHQSRLFLQSLIRGNPLFINKFVIKGFHQAILSLSDLIHNFVGCSSELDDLLWVLDGVNFTWEFPIDPQNLLTILTELQSTNPGLQFSILADQYRERMKGEGK